MNLLTPAAPLDVSTPGVSVVALAGGRWRVTSRQGAMLGHLEVVDTEAGQAFRAMRFSVRERGFRMLGEFRTATAATDALRFG
ncbi:MAG: hypothetical protein ABIR17_09740 [Pseudolysinimonas sp.]|uniref:hypothetical protein n=1 Tax=Pseudolysinimonas sp. TaxID=2680009 RepID=UPI003265B28D